MWGPGPTLAYRPATGRWRTLPPSPVAQTRAVVVWTGSQMIGWGGGCCGDFLSDGASYRPATNRWRTLPTSPLEGRQTAAGAWTGRKMVIVGGFREEEVRGVVRSVDLADAAAYDPAARRWRRLPSLPTGRRDATAVWDGRDVLVVGGFSVTERPPYRRALAGVFAYRPFTNRWRRLRPLPHGRSGHAAVWTGTRMLVWGGEVRRGGKLRPSAPASHTTRRPTAGRRSRPPRCRTTRPDGPVDGHEHDRGERRADGAGRRRLHARRVRSAGDHAGRRRMSGRPRGPADAPVAERSAQIPPTMFPPQPDRGGS